MQPTTNLSSNELILYPLDSTHLDELRSIYDPQFTYYYPFYAQSVEDLFEKVSSYEMYSIYHKGFDRFVGQTGLLNLESQHRRAEIGATWIGREFQGSVVNPLSKYLLLEECFEKRDFIRIEFKMDVLNSRSRQAVLKLGAKEEGVLRSHMVMSDGRVRDTVYFSILKQEWFDVVKGSLLDRIELKR